MKYVVEPDRIKEIDAYAEEVLGIPASLLMQRAGDAVVQTLLSCPEANRLPVLVFCGTGNNGGDGYAAALALHRTGISVRTVSVFGKAPAGEAARSFYDACRTALGEPLTLAEAAEALGGEPFSGIDAVFGTGFHGEMPEEALEACRLLNLCAVRVAADVPLGVNAANGTLSSRFCRADKTAVLTAMKPGLLSYPAKEAVGEAAVYDLGLPLSTLAGVFGLAPLTDMEYVKARLPKRADNSHKGSFGRLFLVAGSAKYRGAALLAAYAALRGGAGYVTLAAEETVLQTACRRFPELLLHPLPPFSALTLREAEKTAREADKATAAVLGPGCGEGQGIFRLTEVLLRRAGCPLLLDADAVNRLAEDREKAVFLWQNAKREVILTPHPLEFSRLSGESPETVAASRMETAGKYAALWHAAVALKGAATVVATPGGVSVNVSGSNALAKAGSGDVLAGFAGALLAQGIPSADALRIAVYLHGLAGDVLARKYSQRGVTPSDLPAAVARLLRQAEAE
ncbi:MAG: NAD(P)H-hydrate dehydratase [Clostridia bacterium]|nr:NAD(P)H-hydrate dehydratase [Clostridia bacterium]